MRIIDEVFIAPTPHEYQNSSTLETDSTAFDISRPYIGRLRLTNFRSYEAVDFKCAANIVVLTGDNGVGKTNILEAISVLGSGRGLRRSAIGELANFVGDGGWSVVADVASFSRAPVEDQARLIKEIEAKKTKGKKEKGEMRIGVGVAAGEAGRNLRIDGERMRGFEHVDQALPQLWLTPDIDRLFVGGATSRRRFLDRFAQTLNPALTSHLNRFEKAMRERNQLLQNNRASEIWLSALEETMAVQAVAIAGARLAALDCLASGLASAPDVIFPKAVIALEGTLETDLRQYAALEVEDNYRKQLLGARALDAAAGRTLEGPHRSDLHVTYEAKNLPAAACSTGEQKALLVGLILAQARSVAMRVGIVPILLLDEVGAHLDAAHRTALVEILSDLGGQSWITATEAYYFKKNMRDANYGAGTNLKREKCANIAYLPIANNRIQYDSNPNASNL